MPLATHELVHIAHPLGGQAQAMATLRGGGVHQADALLGTWATETGILNRVVALRALDPPEGEVDTLGHDDGRLLGEVRRRMTVRRAVNAVVLASPVLELRQYTPHAGQCATFLDAMLSALQHRERYSLCAGVWTTRERGHDVVVHLWGYRAFDERVTVRNAAMRDDAWNAYRAYIRPLLATMHSTLLVRVSP